MSIETKSAAEMAVEVKAAFEARTNEVKGIAEKALAEAAKGIGMSETVKELADAALLGMNEAKARLDELEQKAVRPSGGDVSVHRSAGTQFVESDEYKSFMASGKSRGSVSVEMKAIISSLTTLADGSAGDLLEPLRLPIVAPVDRRMTVRSLIMPGRTSQPMIQYPVETGFTNAAATVSETSGATKPQSEIQFDIVTGAVTTIATTMPATRQIMDDAPMLQSYIDARLRFALATVEEQQLLNGSGTGTNLRGLVTAATAFAAGSVIIAGATNLDVLRIAMLQAALAEFMASGHVINPLDWAVMETLKDTQGRYIIGNPQEVATPRLWGLPVIATQAMGAGSFLTGAFMMGAQIFDCLFFKDTASTENVDNFVKNLVTIRAEERLALAIYRPQAFITGTYAAARTDLAS